MTSFLAARRGRMRPSGGIGAVVGDDIVFEGFKGIDALHKIMTERRGICPEAYTLEDGTPIDIVWGKVTDAVRHKGYGISHILDKHGAEVQNQAEVICLIDRGIRCGVLNPNLSDIDRRAFETENERVIISIYEQRRAFVLTAYLIKKGG